SGGVPPAVPPAAHRRTGGDGVTRPHLPRGSRPPHPLSGRHVPYALVQGGDPADRPRRAASSRWADEPRERSGAMRALQSRQGARALERAADRGALGRDRRRERHHAFRPVPLGEPSRCRRVLLAAERGPGLARSETAGREDAGPEESGARRSPPEAARLWHQRQVRRRAPPAAKDTPPEDEERT